MKLYVRRWREGGAPGRPDTFVVAHRLELVPEERQLLERFMQGWQQSWTGEFKDLIVLADVEVIFKTPNVREAQYRDSQVWDACRDFLVYLQEVREFGGEDQHELD